MWEYIFPVALRDLRKPGAPFVYINENFAVLFEREEISANSLAGRGLESLLDEHDLFSENARTLSRALETGITVDVPLRVRTETGVHRQVHWFQKALADASGRLVYALNILQDIEAENEVFVPQIRSILSALPDL
jgi:PAS domain-containing protein